MRLSNWTWPDVDLFGSTADEAVWTGAIISQNGEILTTSEGLWDSHVVDLQFADGGHAEACVTGRDDRIGLALLQALGEPRDYHFLRLSRDTSSPGQQLELFQHAHAAPEPEQQRISIGERTTAANGYEYMRLYATEAGTTDGATLLNPRGELQGMFMPHPWLRRYEVGNPGEAYAIDVPGVTSAALPLLRSGRIHIERDYMGDVYVVESASSVLAVDSGRPSPLGSSGGVRAASMSVPNALSWSPPVHTGPVYHGEVTIDGNPAPVGSILHARVSKDGQPDYWTSETVQETGFFFVMILVPTNYYLGATIEFWMNCRRSPTTATYEPPFSSVSNVDLAF